MPDSHALAPCPCTQTALDAGLNVVLCIGETKEERDADRVRCRARCCACCRACSRRWQTMEVCIEQLTPVVRRLAPEDWHRVVIAYEPVWAIGTGITATSEQARITVRRARGHHTG